MTTRIELRDRIRKELGDETVPYLWADDLFDLYIANAVNRLSRDLPAEGEGEIVPVVGQKEYDLVPLALAVTRVEYPTGEFPRRDPAVAGDVLSQGFNPDQDYQAWEAYDGRLCLRVAPTSTTPNILYRYRQRYTVPSADASILDVPADYEILLAYLACGEAVRWWEKQQGKRSVAIRPGAQPTVSLDAGAAYEKAYKEAVRTIKGRAVRSKRLQV